MFHYIDGGAEDETTMRRNRADFARWSFVPHYSRDVSRIDLATNILGSEVAMPIIASPTGMSRLFHPQGESAVARAARKAEILYSLSTMGSTSIEDVAAVSAGPKCFQIYAFRDRGLTAEMIARARDAGFTSICLTIDVPVAGKRDRELRTGMTLPPKLGLMQWADIAAHPRWVWNHLSSPRLRLANVAHRVDEADANVSTLATYIANQFDPSIGWSDVEWIAREWGGPFAVKGILHRGDARQAVASGASAVWVSNHGGRQLDGAISSITALPAIAEAIGGSAQIILDGGVRRGSHAAKALALGADACAIGRPYLYGLAAGGEAGVARALEILRDELARSMALIGAADIASLRDARLVEREVER